MNKEIVNRVRKRFISSSMESDLKTGIVNNLICIFI